MKTAGYILGFGFLGATAITVLTGGNAPTPTPATHITPPSQAAVPINLPPITDFSAQAEIVSTKPAPTTQKEVPLSNDNYYTNVDGNKVHSPAYAPSVPAGASARCRDGTYSFSQNRRGTCSHHGGVAQWL